MAKQLSCGVGFLRGLLLLINILFVLVGLALIAIGVYIKLSNNFASILNEFTDMGEFDAQSLGFLAFVMIGGGVFTLLLALFGCMGTLWHNRCLLYMYAVILLSLMILELVAFIMALVYKSKLTGVYETALSSLLAKGLKNNNTKILAPFRDLENKMKCCGANNISDYYSQNYTRAALSSYCQDHGNSSKGCSAAIIDFLSTNLPVIGYSLGSVLLLELFGLIAAIVLAVALKHAPDEDYSSSPGEVLKNIVPGRRRNY